MKIISFLVVLGFMFVSPLYAQQRYSWDEYGISFTLADDFRENTNNIEEFSASGDGMEMSIFPFKDANINDDDISQYTIGIAESIQMQEVDDVDLITLNDFKGGYVEGVKDGTRMFLMGLIDPNSDTNFFVLIAFANKDDEAVKEAVNIVKSIKKQ